MSAYLFDTASQQVSFADGEIDDKGGFSLTTSASQSLSGAITQTAVTASYLGQNVTATRSPVFRPTDRFAGRFTTTAEGSSGESLDVKIVIDSQGYIFLVTKQGSTVLGGFGTVTPSSGSGGRDDDAFPTPSPSPSASPEPRDDDGHDGDDDDDDRGRHGGEDDDEAEDHHEDRNGESFNATFRLTLVTGQTVTGHLVFSHGLLLGDLTFNGVVYDFRAPHESAANHLANISTRAFVNTGKGQLIGGFIIAGGPKMVVIRAMGPSLAESGVSPALADPIVQLFNGDTLVCENDDWQSASNAS